jgi:hydroxymethylglutaryl-CoA synthase
MMSTPTFGIDTAAFHTSHYYLNLRTLAEARGVDSDKYRIGLGQNCMGVNPPDEGIVTMAASAADQILTHDDKQKLSHVLFATESSIDQSKSAGVFVHRLLKLPATCRVVELKQACYSATAALQMSLALLQQHPEQKILIIASDIARYGLNTTGESSQGGGAVALLISANPRMIAIEPESGYLTEDAMDFWRPNYRNEALVDGRFSCELYLRLLKETWQLYQHKSQRPYESHQHFCYHIPLPRLAEKAQQKLAMLNGLHHEAVTHKIQALQPSLYYSREVGNCYTASLFLGLISLLEQNADNLAGQRIGFYSYGSGATAEFFSGVVQADYQQALHTAYHQALLADRTALTQTQYEHFYLFHFPTDGSRFIVPKNKTGRFRLSALDQHKRIYEDTAK